MNFGLFVQGVIIGFSIAAPVGPIGLLCIRRTLAEGALLGFVCGLGAATADAVYGSIAGMGLTFISDALIAQEIWLRVPGGIFLCWLGGKTFLSAPVDVEVGTAGEYAAAAFASTFFLTLTNPMTILSFTAIFAGLGVGSSPGHYDSAGLLVLGVFSGSAVWWLILSGTVSLVRSNLNRRGLQWVNRIAGIILVSFGLFALIGLRR